LLYLVGIERPNLLVCVKEPITNANSRKDKKVQPHSITRTNGLRLFALPAKNLA
ncbi:hypothetical protein BDW02DRAFT_511608, partial [Decorospora gaudefroyi]